MIKSLITTLTCLLAVGCVGAPQDPYIGVDVDGDGYEDYDSNGEPIVAGQAQALDIATSVQRSILLSASSGDTCANMPTISTIGTPVATASMPRSSFVSLVNDFGTACPTTADGDPSFFTIESDGYTFAGSVQRDFIVKFVPPANGTYEFSVAGSASVSALSPFVRTRISVSRGDTLTSGRCTGGDTLTCADRIVHGSSASNATPSVRVDALAGVPHFVRIWASVPNTITSGWGGGTQTFGSTVNVNLALNITQPLLASSSALASVSASGNTCSPIPSISSTGSNLFTGLLGVFNTNLVSGCVIPGSLATSDDKMLRRNYIRFVAPNAGQFQVSVNTTGLYPSVLLGDLPYSMAGGSGMGPDATIGLKSLSSCGASAACSLSSSSPATSRSVLVNATSAGQVFNLAVESNASSGLFNISVTPTSISIPVTKKAN